MGESNASLSPHFGHRKSMAHSKIAKLRLRNADLNLMSKESIKTRSIVVPPQSEIRNSQSEISSCCLLITSLALWLTLLDHLVCSHQHVRGNRQADLLGGFEVDDELEPSRLLDREIYLPTAEFPDPPVCHPGNKHTPRRAISLSPVIEKGIDRSKGRNGFS
jgi:hypothetical protein